jgi:Zn-dependent M32 family carboxypeptidase
MRTRVEGPGLNVGTVNLSHRACSVSSIPCKTAWVDVKVTMHMVIRQRFQGMVSTLHRSRHARFEKKVRRRFQGRLRVSFLAGLGSGAILNAM